MKKYSLIIIVILLSSVLLLLNSIDFRPKKLHYFNTSEIHRISSSTIHSGTQTKVYLIDNIINIDKELLNHIKKLTNATGGHKIKPKKFNHESDIISIMSDDIELLLTPEYVYFIEINNRGILNDFFSIYYSKKLDNNEKKIYQKLKIELLKSPYL